MEAFDKGDLVLVSDGATTSTCIILTSRYDAQGKTNYVFYYTYCLETGLFGIVYLDEIVSVVCKDFAPDFEFHSELFETDYSFHEAIFENFSYFPGIWNYDLDDDSSDDE
tara:strand:- start:67 stop:396 length:330 start_codon:yes stop_codon:yes gene_type:complete